MNEPKLTFYQWCKLPENMMLKIYLASRHKVFWTGPISG